MKLRAILFGLILGCPFAFAQYSTSGGGSSVTITQGGNNAAVNASGQLSVLATQTGTWNVTVNTALPAGSAVIGKVSIDQTTPGITNLIQVGGSLPSGTNVVGKVNSIPFTSCTGNTFRDTGLVTLTSTPTAPAAMNATTCVFRVFLTNTTGASHTITITDNQGSPVTYIPAFTMAAGSTFVIDFGGMSFSSGIKWSADAGSSINAQAVGVQ